MIVARMKPGSWTTVLGTWCAVLTLVMLELGVSTARADTLIISHPGDHPRYSFEAEPHLVLGFIEPPGYATGTGFGVGFRGTVPIVRNGFIPKLNNSIGIGFGLDFARYGAGDYCTDGGDLTTCDDRHRSNGFNELYFPVVLQWNFFLSRNWSVFGEPGVAVTYHAWEGAQNFDFNPFVFFVGGRYHFTDKITLTMRVGYPAFSVGCSFLL